MSLSSVFIKRPVATTLLTLGLAMAGLLAYLLLPVAPLPQVDSPTIRVQALLPGASPDTVAATVATPLERSLGRISGLTEMTSVSAQGSTSIILQFDLDRDINGAARDVQAAINAARSLLPTGMPGNPVYRKVNPADAPVLILALTSNVLPADRLYDAASTLVAQRLSQVDGVGQVIVGGSSMPAVRVDVNPLALSHAGVSLETVRGVLAANNVNRPKGYLEDGVQRWQIIANDQARTAEDYRHLVISWANGSALRLQDVGVVSDSVEDVRNAGLVNGKPSIILLLFKQPGANIIETVDRVKSLLPGLQAAIPQTASLDIAIDRSPSIKSALREVERTMLISVLLVVLVTYLFLRNFRATLIPAVTIPVSLLATCTVMYLCGYSIDTLSLMAMTVAAGFVVDDAIVVMENISRQIESGLAPMQAALRGAREVGFTVVSMTLSLIAVFVPIIFMGGLLGRLFREFAVTLAVAVTVSLWIALTTTPAMCARMMTVATAQQGRWAHWLEQRFERLLHRYILSLHWALQHRRLILLSLFGTMFLNLYLFASVPKGLMPQQDSGRLRGGIQADQGISFQSMQQKLAAYMQIIQSDPAVDVVLGTTGGSGGDARNAATLFVSLKPLSVRRVSSDEVAARLRPKLARVKGASLFLQAPQDVRVGGRVANAQYQYSLQADDLGLLRTWAPSVVEQLKKIPQLEDVNADTQDRGRETLLQIDRERLGRLGLTAQQLDSVLYDAFGQRQVSTIYAPLNQYHVVLEASPAFLQYPEALNAIYLGNAKGRGVPLSSVMTMQPDNAPLSVNHQGQFAAFTLSFNLARGVSLSQASIAIDDAIQKMHLPGAIHGSMQGTAKAFAMTVDNEALLIITAILVVYIVLGILYESYMHPITILSTLPSAGVGAVAALKIFGGELNLISVIGVVLLIGIVKKNAIMMVDFAVLAQRKGCDTLEAIEQASRLRFRPILMTTMAAMLGAMPLALGFGEGAEMRRPLGIAIVGGLAVSQVLTLYTTPVVYFYLDRLQQWLRRFKGQSRVLEAKKP